MHAYYFDNLPTDQRHPHTGDPLQPVSAETLAKLGVLSWHVPVDGHEAGVDEGDDFEVNRVAKERGNAHGRVDPHRGRSGRPARPPRGHLLDFRDFMPKLTFSGSAPARSASLQSRLKRPSPETNTTEPFYIHPSQFPPINACIFQYYPLLVLHNCVVLNSRDYHRFTLDTKDQIWALRLFKPGFHPVDATALLRLPFYAPPSPLSLPFHFHRLPRIITPSPSLPSVHTFYPDSPRLG
ncbi:hypothetical protein C8R45DRAFT_1179059 [Mycena sanguinolenta]|nr:hypothetical protein C8R45DRAFT_1179059 [Mycena sanguinolenta]